MSLSASDRTFNERQSGVYSTTVKDPAGNAIPLSKVTSLTLTLKDADAGTAINARDDQDVLNTNNVEYDANGLLTWTIKPADNAIVSSTRCPGEVEEHVATFWLKWSDGGEDFEHTWTVVLLVIALDEIP